MIPEAQSIAMEVDGLDGTSWTLPLKEQGEGGVEPIVEHDPEK